MPARLKNQKTMKAVMLLEYLDAAMMKAKYSQIKDAEPYYGEIPPCRGVWAMGKTPAECKRNLRETLEGWLFVRISKGLPIPILDGKTISPLARVTHAQTEAGQMA